MASKFRVRFVGDGNGVRQKGPMVREHRDCQPRALDIPNKRRKSRFACLECKRRHLKCDETFPVCLRCQQGGVNCHSPFRSAQWQVEIPGLTVAGPLSNIKVNINHRLLQYWLEKASQIMVIDPNINPFSFDIVRYLETSESLVHGIQSLSVAHESFFGNSSLQDCLKERGNALTLIQKELKATDQPLPGTLLAVLLLGLSSIWVYHQSGDDYGQGHIFGARAILDTLLSKPDSAQDPFTRLAVATYLLWYQATSFLQAPCQQKPLYTPELFGCVQTMSSEYNATVGYLAKIMYLLGDIGSYCRMIIDGWGRDLELEQSFKNQLLASDHVDGPPGLVNDSFVKHGLIIMYRSIESSSSSPATDTVENSRRDIVQLYAKDILQNIEQISEECHYQCILGQPLLTAGSELDMEDFDLRERVRECFRKLFSLTRIPANLHAIEFLEEIWRLRDRGEKVFWMRHLLKKDKFFVLC
ncbi:fungal-specific transcription factor domain-containing protein [Mariannaea sp. PMI_226]|nr:fungal-specific transcription factor domain-containing protein [Mariannaea sp. PMI_226]